MTSPASRPASFISVEAESCSGPELSERNHEESEDEGKFLTLHPWLFWRVSVRSSIAVVPPSDASVKNQCTQCPSNVDNVVNAKPNDGLPDGDVVSLDLADRPSQVKDALHHIHLRNSPVFPFQPTDQPASEEDEAKDLATTLGDVTLDGTSEAWAFCYKKIFLSMTGNTMHFLIKINRGQIW